MAKNSKKLQTGFWRRHLHWLFFVLFVVSGVTCVYSLRSNNLQAIKLRNQVLAADKSNGDVEGALQSLRHYIYSHMNTDLAGGPDAIKPSIQLKYTYQRLVDADKSKVAASNAIATKAAQTHCRVLVGIDIHDGRQACINNYVYLHGAKAKVIPDALYKFDFTSPVWSSDLAGFSMLVAALSLILFATSFGLEKWLRSNVRSQL